MIRYYLIFSLISYYCLCKVAENTSENVVKKNGGFLFSMPKMLVTGKNESVCLSLHDAGVPAKAIIDLKWKEKHFPTIRHLDTEHSCFELYVPHLKIKEPHYVNIRVHVQLNGDIETSHNHDPVLLYPNKLVKSFISTDREIYKPGDKVKFRIFTIDEQLLPHNSKISKIQIKNPLDITVAVWENIIPENGLVSLDYQMVPESITGKWKIETSGETKLFEISKYVLPRFKIDLFYPKLVYYKTEGLNIKVCGEYSYGRSLKGIAFVKVTDSHNNMKPVQELKEIQDGCAVFIITPEQLALSTIKEKFPMYDPKMYVHITATVTEKGTNRIEVTTGRTLVFLKTYTMKFISSPVFQPGLPYKGKIKLNNIQTNLANELIEICYNVAIKKSWNYLNNEQCSKFAVNDDNTVDFNVLPMRSNIIHIHFNARSLNHTNIGDSFLAVRLFSPSNSYILLQQHVVEKSRDECRAPQQFTVYYTTDRLDENDDITFYYMIKSQDRIYKLRRVNHLVKKNASNYLDELKNIIGVKHKFTKSGTSIDNFTLKFRLDRRIGNKYQLLVYYVTKDGETVATNRDVDVDACLLKVEAKWKQKQTVPGATATLNIKTGAHSLCSISATDKSLKFMSTNRHSFDANTLYKSFMDERDFPVSGRQTCVAPTKRSGQAAPLSFDMESSSQSTLWDLRRRKRHIYSFSEDFDSYDIFTNFGTVVITNLKVVNKPCYTGPLLKDNTPVQFLTGQYDDQNEEKSVSIRSYFPETWLWELVPVSDQVQLNRHLPHSITNWVTNVLCISDEEGLGFSQETEITTFQSFFVELIAPYSVKRDENFYLYIHISNYLSYTFPVRITLRLSDGLELYNSKEEMPISYCLQENNTVTHIIRVKGTKMGIVNATVLVESDNQYPEQCGPETIVSKRDIVLKTIHVESEGYPMKITKSALLCASDSHSSTNVSWQISTHKEIVPGTEKLHMSLNGDLLGQTIENLEELLDVPTGCGEQIMATIAPNLYVLRYLNATDSLKNSIRHRIIRNLKIGYQRILNYAHKDGSFSAFGYHDSTGSMFLTAFVVRTLQEAKQHIYIDQRVIDKAVSWIFDHQLENGCFNTMLHVFQDMGGTSKENSTASLTAYVIISLIEANIKVPKTVQTNAKYCIRSQHNPDKYALALSCYALYKINWHSEADRMLDRLLAVSNQQHNMLWWSNKDNNTAAATDIEITSYVLLSLLNQDTTENLANAHSIVRWLSSKYGPRGGFKSTQDTVVALDALSKYSRLVSMKNLHLKVNIETNEQKLNVSLSNEDRLKSTEVVLDNNTNKINIAVEGEGCVLAQVIQSYYLMRVPKSEAFKLAVDVAPVSTIDQCSITSVSPCLAYTGPDGPANMAVMEVALPSGYVADRASLYNLIEPESSSRIKMFEELDDKINLYFTKLDKQLVCFSFNINENSMVETRKDSVVKLYDYYRPEYEILEFYRINGNCQQNNSIEIPEIIAKPLSTKIKVNNVTIELPEVESSESLNQENIDQIVKRSTDYQKSDREDSIRNSTKTGLNQKFVYKDVDMEFSNCNGNIPYYAIPLYHKRDVGQSAGMGTKVKTRNSNLETPPDANHRNRTKTGINPDFVETNVDIEFSNCNGNVPYYTTKDVSNDRTKRNVETRRMNPKTQFVEQHRNISNSRKHKMHSTKDASKKNFRRNGGDNKPTINVKVRNKKIHRRVKRHIKTKRNLNPGFIDMDVDMEMPKGMEGNAPMYVKPSSEELKNMTENV